MSHGKYDFRMRGTAMSRIDAFSDVVFGFALTLLVVSLEVPKTYEELMHAVRGFVPFAICFALLLFVWYEHYIYFRRYNLHRVSTILLNAVLLFLVLFYVYPMKFLFTLVTGQAARGVHPEDTPHLMMLYASGYTAVYAVFSAMYYDALRARDELELTEVERYDTVTSVIDNVLMMLVGVVAILSAAIVPANLAGLTGFTYTILIPIARSINGAKRGDGRRKLITKLQQAEVDDMVEVE